MALPTLRSPMQRTNRRDELMPSGHSSRHANYIPNMFNTSERPHQYGRFHDTNDDNGFRRQNKSVMRSNESSSRGASIANYHSSRSSNNNVYGEAQLPGPLPCRERFVKRDNNMDVSPASARVNTLDTHRVRPQHKMGFHENEYRIQQNGGGRRQQQQQQQQQRIVNGGAKPDFDLPHGSSSSSARGVMQKDLGRSETVFMNARKLEGCNTLKDGRDIEAIAPAPTSLIKVFDRHGRELSTRGSQHPQDYDAAVNNHSRPPHGQRYKQLNQLNRRPAYQQQNKPFQQLQPHNKRGQYAYDRSQSLFGSQHQQPSAFPFYKGSLRIDNRDFNEAARPNGFAVENSKSTVLETPAAAAFSAGSSSHDSSRKNDHASTSPPLEFNRDVLRTSSILPSSSSSAERDYPHSSKPSAAAESGGRRHVLHAEKDFELNVKREAKDLSEDTLRHHAVSYYHYKKSKLLGRGGAETVRSTSDVVVAKSKERVRVFPTELPAASSNADVFVESTNIVPVSHKVASPTVSSDKLCPCVPAAVVADASSALCCLNAASAKDMSKFTNFLAFQHADNRCRALKDGIFSINTDSKVAADSSMSASEQQQQQQQAGGGSPPLSSPPSPADSRRSIDDRSVAKLPAIREVNVCNFFAAQHAESVRKNVAHQFEQLDTLAQLITRTERCRRRTSISADKLAGGTPNESALTKSPSYEQQTDQQQQDENGDSKAFRKKSRADRVDTDWASLFSGASIVSTFPVLRSAVDSFKIRAVSRYLKQLYIIMLSNFESTSLYQCALQGYQKHKVDKLLASGEPMPPKRLVLARTVAALRRMMTNYRKLSVEKRVENFLHYAANFESLPVYRNAVDALAVSSTTLDIVVSGMVSDKTHFSPVGLRVAVRERIIKQLGIGLMMEKVCAQIQKSKREKLLNERSDLCGNTTFLKGLDIVTQTFDKVNQRMSWNEELDLLLGYDELEDKMSDCTAPLNSFERRSTLATLADEKFRNGDTVEFVLNMNNVPPPVNPYKPLQLPKVSASTSSFKEQYAAHLVTNPRQEFNDYVSAKTATWSRSQVELFASSYREHPKYWLEICRNMSLPTPNDSVTLYRLLKISTYEYGLAERKMLDKSNDDWTESDVTRNNAGLSSSVLHSAPAPKKTSPVPFSFFHLNKPVLKRAQTQGGDTSSDSSRTLKLSDGYRQLDAKRSAEERGGFFMPKSGGGGELGSAIHSSADTTMSASNTILAMLPENAVLKRWSFDITPVLARLGSSWHNLTVNTSRDVNEQYDAKWKALAKKEKSDVVALKRERVRALKVAKREARKIASAASGRRTHSTALSASASAVNLSASTTQDDDMCTVDDGASNSPAENVAVEAADGGDAVIMKNVDDDQTAEFASAIENIDDIPMRSESAVPDTSLTASAAADALLELSRKIEPAAHNKSGSTASSSRTTAESPFSPRTPPSSPPTLLYLMEKPVDIVENNNTLPTATTSAQIILTTPVKPPEAKVTPQALKKKRGRRKKEHNNNSSAVVAAASASSIQRLSTSASVVAAGAGCGIAKSTNKTVRAAKRSAMAAFNDGRSGTTGVGSSLSNGDNNLAAKIPSAPAVASVETMIAKEAMAGLIAALSPPSGAVSAEDDSNMSSSVVVTAILPPLIDAEVQQGSSEKQARAGRRAQALPTVSTGQAIRKRKNLAFKTNRLPTKPSSSSLAAVITPTTVSDSRRSFFFASAATAAAAAPNKTTTVNAVPAPEQQLSRIEQQIRRPSIIPHSNMFNQHLTTAKKSTDAVPATNASLSQSRIPKLLPSSTGNVVAEYLPTAVSSLPMKPKSNAGGGVRLRRPRPDMPISMLPVVNSVGVAAVSQLDGSESLTSAALPMKQRHVKPDAVTFFRSSKPAAGNALTDPLAGQSAENVSELGNSAPVVVVGSSLPVRPPTSVRPRFLHNSLPVKSQSQLQASSSSSSAASTTFNGSRFVSRTAQQQVTFGRVRPLSNTVPLSTEPYNHTQADGPKRLKLDNYSASGVSGPIFGGTVSRFTPNGSAQAQQFHYQRRASDANAATTVFRSSIMLGDKKKRLDFGGGGGLSQPTPLPSSTRMFPEASYADKTSSSTVAASALLDDVLSAYKRGSSKMGRKKRKNAAMEGRDADADAGDLYENVSDTSS